MVGMRAAVGGDLVARAAAVPLRAIPYDVLDAEALGVGDEPVGDGVAAGVVRLAARGRDEDVDGAAGAVHRGQAGVRRIGSAAEATVAAHAAGEGAPEVIAERTRRGAEAAAAVAAAVPGRSAIVADGLPLPGRVNVAREPPCAGDRDGREVHAGVVVVGLRGADAGDQRDDRERSAKGSPTRDSMGCSHGAIVCPLRVSPTGGWAGVQRSVGARRVSRRWTRTRRSRSPAPRSSRRASS